MKRSLRATLLAVLLGLTALTAGVIGVVAYLDARDTATDLTQRTLFETSKRIEGRVDELVGIARRQVDLNEQLLGIDCPGLVQAEWLDQGICIRGRWFPAVKMRWV